MFCFLVLCVSISKSTLLDPAPGCHLTMNGYLHEYKYYKEGDIIIGGIITVLSEVLPIMHEGFYDISRLCAEINIREYRQFQAFILAIDEINRNPDILPNITLGYHVYDSCGKVLKVLKDVLQIMSGTMMEAPNYRCMDHGKLAGFIGDHYSLTTLPMAQLLNVFGYTQISYGARDPLPSDRKLFPNLFRTVQNYQVQYMAIAKLLKSFGWNWVGVITSDDEAGDQELVHISKEFNSHGICIEYKIKVSQITLHPTIPLLLKTSSTQMIVICGTHNLAFHNLLVTAADVLLNKTIILPASWSHIKHLMLIEMKQIFDYSLVLSSPFQHIPALQERLYSLHPSRHPNDKLLEDVWIFFFQCFPENNYKKAILSNIFQLNFPSCTGKENLTQLSNYSEDPTAYQMYTAVLSMAQALHDVTVVLNMYGKQEGFETFSFKHKLRNFVKKVKYTGLYQENIFFNEKGEVPETLDIVSRVTAIIDHRNKVTYKQTDVGKFHPSDTGQQLEISPQNITWKNGKVPHALCSPVCLPGTRKALWKGYHTCYYDCIMCSEGEFSNVSDRENCQKCPDDEWPNEGKNKCIPRISEFLSYTNDTIAAVYSIISILFYILTVFIIRIFVLNRNTPIVKANNINLTFILLISIQLSLLCVFLFIGRPVHITCMLRQISFGIIFTVAVSSILAKTIMVCIAFKATRPGRCWRKWLGVKLPNSVVLICSSVQVLTSAIWLSVSPPFQEYDKETFPGMIIIQCNKGSVLAFYFMLGYMGILAAVSFILAFMVRTLPDIFNEAKYITFSMLMFCSVWVCAIPSYLSSRGKNMVTVEIFAILASGITILSCIFFPKCYYIIMRPEMNNKKHLLQNNDS